MGQNYCKELFDCKTRGAKRCWKEKQREHLRLAPLRTLWGVTVTSCFPMWLWLSLVCVFVSLDVNSLCSGSETSNLTHIPVSKTVHSIYSLKTLLIIWCSESYAWNIYKETWARLLVLREVGLCRQGNFCVCSRWLPVFYQCY